MKLYVCWGTFNTPRPHGHPCHNAYAALQEAGWEPDVQRTYGWAALPTAMNPKRKPVRELTGSNWVPVLVTDEDEVVQGSQEIVDGAKANPATASDAA